MKTMVGMMMLRLLGRRPDPDVGGGMLLRSRDCIAQSSCLSDRLRTAPGVRVLPPPTTSRRRLPNRPQPQRRVIRLTRRVVLTRAVRLDLDETRYLARSALAAL